MFFYFFLSSSSFLFFYSLFFILYFYSIILFLFYLLHFFCSLFCSRVCSVFKPRDQRNVSNQRNMLRNAWNNKTTKSWKTNGARNKRTRLECQIFVVSHVLCVGYPVCKVVLASFNFVVISAPFQRCFQQPRVKKISGEFWAQIENPLQRRVW